MIDDSDPLVSWLTLLLLYLIHGWMATALFRLGRLHHFPNQDPSGDFGKLNPQRWFERLGASKARDLTLFALIGVTALLVPNISSTGIWAALVSVPVYLLVITALAFRTSHRPLKNENGSLWITFLLLVPFWLPYSVLRLAKVRLSPSSPHLFPFSQSSHWQSRQSELDKPHDVGQEVQLLQNALDFREVQAKDCMIPRNEIVSIEVDQSTAELKKKFVDSHFSKILVYEGDTDNIIGYVHNYDLFKLPKSIRSILLPISVIPETLDAQLVLKRLVLEKRSIAILVDEFGGLSGLIALEDLLEEIVGEIEDEHDVPELIEERLPGRQFLFSGRLEIDYLNEKYGFNLPISEHYDTLAGFVLDQMGDIPGEESGFEWEQYSLTARKVSKNRIELIHLHVKG